MRLNSDRKRIEFLVNPLTLLINGKQRDGSPYTPSTLFDMSEVTFVPLFHVENQVLGCYVNIVSRARFGLHLNRLKYISICIHKCIFNLVSERQDFSNNSLSIEAKSHILHLP